jgi:hypothetical protein
VTRDSYPPAQQAIHRENRLKLHQGSLVRPSRERWSLRQPTGRLPSRTGLRGGRRSHGGPRNRGGAGGIPCDFVPGAAGWNRENQE